MFKFQAGTPGVSSVLPTWTPLIVGGQPAHFWQALMEIFSCILDKPAGPNVV